MILSKYVLNKSCSRCDQILAIKYFYLDKKKGYKSICKLCTNSVAKAKSFMIDEYYEINGKYYMRKIKSFIRDDDEATNDIRAVYNIKPTKLIDIWSLKKEEA